MSQTNSPADDLKRWKDRYFAQAEQFEQQENALKDHVNLLQRILIRVSMAAEGLDPRLDKELETLRLILRREDGSRQGLPEQLEQIERAVLRLDEDKQDAGERMLEGLSKLVEQLLELGLSREQKKLLKKFSQDLKERLQNLRDYPNLLSEYASLQSQALEELFQPEDSIRGGLLQRLLGKGRAPVSQAASPADELAPAAQPEPAVSQSETAQAATSRIANAQPVHTQPADSQPTSLQPISLQPKTAEHAEFALTALDAGSSVEEHQNGLGFSAISEHVCTSLINLLSQLALPETALGAADKVREQISAGLNWYELGPTIDDIANLVIAAVGKGQREFESFLQSLDSRLATLQAFISDGQQYQQDLRRANNDLDMVVRDQVSSISESVRDATDLDSLKQSVQQNLDTIIQTMDEFVRKEGSREAALNQQLHAMQQRLLDMEREGEAIRQRLTDERHRALTDVLTGLPNREAYQERLQQEYDRWHRYGNPLTLVVGDIDHFKSINDRFGHLAGDKVIQIIAKELARRIRRTDFVARYGGEEFVILLPETTLDAARPVLEKAREMIEKLPFHFRNERVVITMSFGLCDFRSGVSAIEVFEKADQALYRAKREGRNRVAAAD